ncbi:MAG: signal peptidase I [Acidobacteriota bacterium]|nr:signal peptidase I [Acidobacteriota bacterium]MDH3522246.1 signal peptidase I [Acidobacteriota bacterium]
MAVRRRSALRENLEALLIAMLFAFFAKTFVIQAFKIPSGSMERNLLIGDHILVNKFVYAPTATALERLLLPVGDLERGDVVVFKFPQDPERDFIKRCIALPGDRVELVDKQTFVNGVPLEEGGYVYFTDSRTYTRRKSLFVADAYRLRDNFGPYTIPEGHYFFLGDNRDNSNDSRFWGTVPAGHVKGRALLVYWSFAGDQEPLEWRGYRAKAERLLAVARGFVSETRWERTLLPVR